VTIKILLEGGEIVTRILYRTMVLQDFQGEKPRDNYLSISLDKIPVEIRARHEVAYMSCSTRMEPPVLPGESRAMNKELA